MCHDICLFVCCHIIVFFVSFFKIFVCLLSYRSYFFVSFIMIFVCLFVFSSFVIAKILIIFFRFYWLLFDNWLDGGEVP